MNPKFMKMLEKKRDLKPHEKAAKMGVLKDMKDAASEMAGDKLGLHKVSVMSDSPEGLEEGLDQAHNAVHQMPDDMSSNDHSDPSDSDAMMNMGGMAYAEGGEVSQDEGEGIEDNRDELANIDKDMEDDDGSGDNQMMQAANEVDHKTALENPGLPTSDVADKNRSNMNPNMDHEHAEDMDLDAIKQKIQHLMGLQSKAESKRNK